MRKGHSESFSEKKKKLEHKQKKVKKLCFLVNKQMIIYVDFYMRAYKKLGTCDPAGRS